MTTALSSGEERGRGSGKCSYATLEGSRNKGRMNSQEIFLSPSSPPSPTFPASCVQLHVSMLTYM